MFGVAEHPRSVPSDRGPVPSSLPLIAFLPNPLFVLCGATTAAAAANLCSLLRGDNLVAPLSLPPPLSRTDGHLVAEAAEEAPALVVPGEKMEWSIFGSKNQSLKFLQDVCTLIKC